MVLYYIHGSLTQLLAQQIQCDKLYLIYNLTNESFLAILLLICQRQNVKYDIYTHFIIPPMYARLEIAYLQLVAGLKWSNMCTYEQKKFEAR